MFGFAKRNAAIVTAVGAMAASVLLLVFFGAWAVAESSQAEVADVFSSATVGFTGSAAPVSGQPAPGQPIVVRSTAGQPASAGGTDGVPRLASTAAGATAADTWWGKALLGACPLH